MVYRQLVDAGGIMLEAVQDRLAVVPKGWVKHHRFDVYVPLDLADYGLYDES